MQIQIDSRQQSARQLVTLDRDLGIVPEHRRVQVYREQLARRMRLVDALFATGPIETEQRRSLRIASNVSAALWINDHLKQLYVVDFSSEGCQLHCEPDPLIFPGMPLTLEYLAIDGHFHPVVVKGQIAWGEPSCIGVRFDRTGGDVRRQLRAAQRRVATAYCRYLALQN